MCSVLFIFNELRASFFWNEIFYQTYNFNRDIIETEELKTVTKSDVLAMYKRCVSRSSQVRRRLSCHVAPERIIRRKVQPEDLDISKWELVTDVTKFKNGLALHPHPEPVIELKTLKRLKKE